MAKKSWWKKPINKVRVWYLVMAAMVMTIGLGEPKISKATSCPNLKIVFARGSGGERYKDQNYLEFKDTIKAKIKDMGLTYEFLDLDYPAVGIGIDNLGVTAGAFFGAGDAYEFGESVDAGVTELARVVNNGCKNTKYVLGGYSQGAMVVSKALPGLDADRVIYAATFGDPKIYLPEGAGLMPAACKNENLSDYRVYVPDCRAYEGLLGSYRPYEPEDFAGKLGTWCNKFDLFCSSHFGVTDHLSYISDNLYEDASRMIAHKITEAFELDNEYVSPHDTVILIDSTRSMEEMLEKFKAEAMRLANETFEAGGRVALYDYRDLDDPYEPVARCDFETCTAENFAEHLNEIWVGSGGDDPESLLSAARFVMHELKWRRGATKSMVVLTDAPYLSPDRDATTVDDVVQLSKRIDPVNIYIITCDYVVEGQPEIVGLAEATGGKVATNTGELSLLTDYIMERFDSLPRVEENKDEEVLPAIEITDISDSGDTVEVKFSGDTLKAVVILNDAVLGVAEGGSVVIDGLDRNVENELVLVPVNGNSKGERVKLRIEIARDVEEAAEVAEEAAEKAPPAEEKPEMGEVKIEPTKIEKKMEIEIKSEEEILIPKTPDTGVVK